MLTAAGPFSPNGGPGTAVRTAPVVQTIATELSYKFNIGGAPVKSCVAAPIAPVNWTGFYPGVGGGGYGFANSYTRPFNTVTNLPLNLGADSGARGYFGSVSGGFDYQFNDKIIAGVLANYDFADIKGNWDTTAYQNFFSPLGGQTKLTKLLGRRRPHRLAGDTANPDLFQRRLHPGLDGTSLRDLQAPGLPPAVGPGFVGSRTYDGWFLGSGVESKLNFLPGNGWFVRTEYRYADYGSKTTPVTTTGGGSFFLNGQPVSLNIHPVVQTVRTELSYKFNWAGPVVAKY